MSDSISYIRIWAAAPCGGGHPAAGLSIFAAGLFITRDVSEPGLMLRRIQRCQRDGLQLQRDETGVRGHVTGVTLWAAHSLKPTAAEG